MNKYKIGIIGCGRIAGYLEDDPLRKKPCTHVGAYHAHPQCDVVACCSREEANAERFAERFSIPRVYTDYRVMLDTEHLDIVSIATYAPSHAAITEYAARSNVRAIFCEKAMATSLLEADRMIQTCRERNVMLTVNHTRRWGRDYIKAHEMIREGAIGALQSMSGTFSGNIIHTGIHMFDAMIYFAGEPKTVWGILTEAEYAARERSGYLFDGEGIHNEDADGVVTIQFENGIIGQAIGIGRRYFIFEMDIQGSDGRIRIGNGLFQYWKRGMSKRYTDFTELCRADITPSQAASSGLVFAVEDIVAALEGGGETRCSGTDARGSLAIALAAHESHSAGGIPILFPLTNISRTVVSR